MPETIQLSPVRFLCDPRIHRFALILPEMSEADYVGLRESIRENGLLEPIVTWRGPGSGAGVVDGKARLRACADLGITPAYVELPAEMSPRDVLDWVIERNVRRRNLRPGELAQIAARATLAPVEVRQRDGSILTLRLTVKEAMAKFGAKRTYVIAARNALLKGSPELIAALEQGDIPLHEASRRVGRPRVEVAVSATAPALSDEHRRRAEAGFARLRQIEEAQRPVMFAMKRAIGQEQRAILRFNATGEYVTPTYERVPASVFDPVAPKLNVWVRALRDETERALESLDQGERAAAQSRMLEKLDEMRAFVIERTSPAEPLALPVAAE